LAAGVANMANSIIGAGIIGKCNQSVPSTVTWILTQWLRTGLPLAIAEAGFFMGVSLLIILAGVTDW
jgi:hypothetical protein